jgi:hypothetical protein
MDPELLYEYLSPGSKSTDRCRTMKPRIPPGRQATPYRIPAGPIGDS